MCVCVCFKATEKGKISCEAKGVDDRVVNRAFPSWRADGSGVGCVDQKKRELLNGVESKYSGCSMRADTKLISSIRKRIKLASSRPLVNDSPTFLPVLTEIFRSKWQKLLLNKVQVSLSKAVTQASSEFGELLWGWEILGDQWRVYKFNYHKGKAHAFWRSRMAKRAKRVPFLK